MIKKTRIGKILFLACFSLIFCDFLIAKSVKSDKKYTINLSTTNLAFGDPLEIEIRYSTRKKHQIGWDTKDFKVNPNPSVSEQTTLINGDISFKRTYTYIAYPDKKGYLNLKITIDENEHIYSIYVSDRKEIKVNKLEDVFITNILSHKRLYLNQIATLQTIIYYRVNINNTFLHQDFDFSAFIETETIKDYRPETVSINGKKYNKQILFKKIIYPIKASINNSSKTKKHNLGSIVLQLDVPKEERRQFFRFLNYRTIKIEGNPVVVEVIDFPSKNKPTAFQNNFGDFDLSIGVSTNLIQQFEPLVLSVRVNGKGNFKALSLPRLEDIYKDNYDIIVRKNPGLKENLTFKNNFYEGSIEQEYYIIPQKSGKLELDNIRFSFFDFKSKNYKVLKTKPPLLNVKKVRNRTNKKENDNERKQAEIENQENSDFEKIINQKDKSPDLEYLFTDISCSKDLLLRIWILLHFVLFLFIVVLVALAMFKKRNASGKEILTFKKVIEKLKKLKESKKNSEDILPNALEILYQHITDELQIPEKQTIRQIEKYLTQKNISNTHYDYCVSLIKKYQKILYLEKKDISHQSEVEKIINYFKIQQYEKK